MSSTFAALVRNAAYGLLMGSADVIPGVSGGTMALIVGVYERLVRAISTAVSLGLALLRLDIDEARAHWAAMPWGLVLPLAGGIGLAIAVGAHLIPSLMAAYPAQMQGLFLGLVAASLLIPARRMHRVTGTYVGLGLCAALLAFYLTGLPVLEATDPGLPRVFLSAAVAICAMILPGVSGAFLLKALGMYTPTLVALKSLHAPYVLTFMAGAALGLGAFAKLLDWLLTHRHDATMAVLIGLIAGALRSLWPFVGPNRSLQWPTSADPVGSVLILTLIGFGVVLALLWWEHRTTADSPVSPTP
jgi:putative membrane protein